jgi:dTDP-glucose pyrophosphorylase
MTEWQPLIISPTSPLRDALDIINARDAKIALVCDENGKLVGTVTDGDVRRALLADQDLRTPVAAAMNKSPATASPDTARDAVRARMHALHILQVPVVDADGRPVGLHLLAELDAPKEHPNWVVLMAGGRGQRLHPLTESLPKPMLTMGGRPILETILMSFVEQGFRRFYVSVNYRAEAIREHFGDGSKWGAKIEYLHETESMGTAGSLSLLPSVPTAPVLVMNADLLTKMNFEAMLNHHHAHNASATMCVREYSMQVPFGVVKFDHERITELVEKPVSSYFINAGIYLLSPSALARIPHATRYDMPSLFTDLIANGQPCCSFPIHEYWIDIGRFSDLEQAHREFEMHFGAIAGAAL